MSSFTDTIMNIEIFAFLGLLVWLYLKPLDTQNDTDKPADPKADITGESE